MKKGTEIPGLHDFYHYIFKSIMKQPQLFVFWQELILGEQPGRKTGEQQITGKLLARFSYDSGCEAGRE